MFTIGKGYSKNDIYEMLNVPAERRRGAWDTGYREYEGNIFLFTNIGIPGRTGHDYNNFWDGDLFFWEGKVNSNINQPIIRKMLHPELTSKIYLFTRTLDTEPFTFEGNVVAKKYKDTVPVQITWELEKS